MSKDGSGKSEVSMKEISRLLKRLAVSDAKALIELQEKCSVYPLTTIIYKDSGDSAIHVAAKTGSLEAVKFLLDLDREIVFAKNKDCKTALHEAAQNAHYEICACLVRHEADINAIKRADWTPLMLACTKVVPGDSLRIVRLFLEKGAIVNFKNKDGWTALHLICRQGSSEILRALLEHGANVQLKTKNGRTGLHIAALHGNIDVLRILLDYGLGVDEPDSCGNTSLHEGILGNRLDVCKVLIDRGANVYRVNKRGYNLLHLAASQGHLDVAEMILSNRGWDINQRTADGFTALHCAARNLHVDMYFYLIKNGADSTISDDWHRHFYNVLRDTNS